MTTSTLRATAIRRHADALREARFWLTPLVMIPRTPHTRYTIQGACRREAFTYLDRAARCRAVYANAERLA